MIKRIIKAEEDLEACVRDLEKADESTAVIEVKEKVLRVKGYLSSSRDNLFTYEHDVVWDKFWGEFVAKWGVMFGDVFLICVGGLQLLFMFFLFKTLFKFRCR
ncbi:hypothetical protein CASFOL_015562 [Castilleja foliolosa]|uniref:Transmembrane protein n=1 Tax=Castilleja foliolosa TaxID=1961234 RepID=A0ABD3DHJ0_9LAMI